jgi:5'-3' exonuclease
VTASPAPLLLAVDGNSLLHRAYHAAPFGPIADAAGRPVWALHGLIGFVARAAARLRPDALLVGFDCREHSHRRADFPDYKAHRPDKPGDLTTQLDLAPDVLRAATVPVAVPPGYEADDVLASAAAATRGGGWRAVVMTSDRDAFALVDEATSVLRVRNGGSGEAVMLTPATLPSVCGVQAAQYPDLAALRGDPSDNLPGVTGFGTATAAKLLVEFGSIEAAWAEIDAGRLDAVRVVVGTRAATHLATAAARETVARNRRLMAMRTDLDLPALADTRLPLDLATMRTALRAHGINLGPSLWALTGGSPPPQPEPEDEPDPVVWHLGPARNLAERRRPQPGQLSLF